VTTTVHNSDEWKALSNGGSVRRINVSMIGLRRNGGTDQIKSDQIQFILLKTHHILIQQVVKAVDEQDQQGSKEHLQ